ncbi:MAG TPA: MFS transporter [Burkholderiales bacterium]|nr:MFS transporter [Burkholderiales bacterium]
MREIIFLLALASANGGVALRAVEPMLPRLASDFGESVSATAVIISAYAFAYAGAQLLYGPLGDRFGKLRVVTLSLAGAALGSFGCALAEDLATLAAMRFATGLFASTPVMLGMAYIGDRVPAAGRQPVIARFIIGTITGQALGPAVGGAATDLIGWRGTFALLGAVFAVVCAILLLRTRAQWGDEKAIALSANPFAVHLRLLRSSRVRHVVAVGFIETFLFFGAFAFLGAYLKLRFDLSLTLIGVILAGFGAGGVLYTFMVRRLLMELGQRGLVVGGGVACFACYVLAMLTPAWDLFIVFTVGLGFSFYMLHNTLQTKATEMAPQARGTALALYSSAWALGQAAGVAAMGLAVGLFDYQAAIIAFGAGYFLLGLWMRRNLERL